MPLAIRQAGHREHQPLVVHQAERGAPAPPVSRADSIRIDAVVDHPDLPRPYPASTANVGHVSGNTEDTIGKRPVAQGGTDGKTDPPRRDPGADGYAKGSQSGGR